MSLSKQVNKNVKEIDKLMESYYSYIGSSHIDNIINDHEEKKEEIGEVQIPKSLDNWFEEYIKKAKKKDKRIRIRKSMKNISSRAAIFVLILFTSLSILTVSVEAFRVRVFNFFMETNEKFTNVRIDEELEDDENDIVLWDGYYLLSYVPEGFRIESKDILNDTRIIQYTDNNNFITFAQAPNGTEFQLDTEGSNISEVMINNNKGIFAEKENINILFWSNTESSFYIISGISSEEIIKISKKIEKK
jgi:hypothetical protein